ERMDPAGAEQVLAELLTSAEAIAGRHGGVLERRASDELLLRFGVPRAREDDGVRATEAALELARLVAAIGTRLEATGGPTIRAHIGVDTGHVVVQPNGAGQYTIAGLAARTATQLAAHAAAGEVWMGPELHRLVSPFFETETGSPVSVPGRDQPLVPRRVLRATGLATRMEAASKLGLTTFTGRDAELARLHECLRAAQD